MESIIGRMELSPGDRAQEMAASARAKLLAYYGKDYRGALALIEEAIDRYPENTYPLLTKAEMALHVRDRVALKEAVDQLERQVGKHAQSFRSFTKFKAFSMALAGDVTGARALIKRELYGLKEATLLRLNEKITQVASGDAYSS